MVARPIFYLKICRHSIFATYETHVATSSISSRLTQILLYLVLLLQIKVMNDRNTAKFRSNRQVCQWKKRLVFSVFTRLRFSAMANIMQYLFICSSYCQYLGYQALAIRHTLRYCIVISIAIAEKIIVVKLNCAGTSLSSIVRTLSD